jgi:hypothetical protein
MNSYQKRHAYILSKLKQGKTVEEIRQYLVLKYGSCHNQRLRQIITELGYKPISIGSGGNNRSVSFNPFEADDDFTQYWVGYIAADGNVSRVNRISISSKDKEHLQKFQQLLKGNGNEHHFVNAAGTDMLALHFTHAAASDTLLNVYGIGPKKSKTLKMLKMNPAILRGIFDGDGSAVKEIKITTGSEAMRDHLMEYLESQGIRSRYRTKGANMDCYDVLVHSMDYHLFYQLIYNGATVFLERKEESMWAFAQRCVLKNGVNCKKAEMLICSQATQKCVEGSTTNVRSLTR